MQILRASASAQQVHPSTAQLACTRAGQQEAHATGFDETVDLIEECGQPLNLINDDDPVLRRQFLREAGRILTERQIDRTVKEVVDPHARQRVCNQKAFARLAWTK